MMSGGKKAIQSGQLYEELKAYIKGMFSQRSPLAGNIMIWWKRELKPGLGRQSWQETAESMDSVSIITGLMESFFWKSPWKSFGTIRR